MWNSGGPSYFKPSRTFVSDQTECSFSSRRSAHFPPDWAFTFFRIRHDPAAADWPHVALTTYGRNNHGIRDEHYRYIHYEEGAEELYDHLDDTHEWNNIAANPTHKETRERLADHLPKVNAWWSEKSAYDYNQYLTEHRKRNL